MGFCVPLSTNVAPPAESCCVKVTSAPRMKLGFERTPESATAASLDASSPDFVEAPELDAGPELEPESELAPELAPDSGADEDLEFDSDPDRALASEAELGSALDAGDPQ